MLNQNRSKVKGPVPRIILGIDPGTGRLGWAVIQKGLRTKDLGLRNNNPMTQDPRPRTSTPILVDCGCIETKANTPLPDRLENIYKEISAIIKKYEPNEMAIEELFFVKNVKTGISVAHARGVVLLAARQNDLSISDYKPNEIKLAIAGHGHADKSQIAKMLKLHLKGCNIKQDDAADAVAVALCHLQSNRRLI